MKESHERKRVTRMNPKVLKYEEVIRLGKAHSHRSRDAVLCADRIALRSGSTSHLMMGSKWLGD
ncbi:hypothetical protein CKO25_02120 [Thiocapsa imhoffii]|uniref:Uncharacterized protein n=1 Tax=Thiocapsa imhoffii TaxID=382777 RepID=A0A9X0WEZ5_9GAMM|nr:hypothetical protein [Thiocapsa imhoffii]